MTRFESPRPDELGAEQREVYDAIAGGPRATQKRLTPVTDDEGRLLGPFGTMTIAPGVGLAVQEVGAAIRFRGVLGADQRELAILAVAEREQSDFEWYAHAGAALAAGVSEDDLAAVKQGGEPADPSLARVWRLTRELMVTGALADGSFADGEGALGKDGVAELVWLVGYYRMLATTLRVWDPPVPDDARGVFGRT